MGYKMTTDPFVLRGATNATITGASGSDTVTLDTSLDTLNREVLIIHEVDISDGAFPDNYMAVAVGGAGTSLEIHNAVQTASGSLNLDSVDYIGGKKTKYFGFAQGVMVQENVSPDARDMPSRDTVPLAIITDSTITLRTGFTASVALSSSDAYSASFRIICQRAKADADTYAALVTGLL